MEKRDTPYADAYRRRMAQKNAPTLARKETPKHSIKKKCIVEKVKEEVKGVKDFAHKEEKALEKKFGKKKVRKVEHYIVFSIYVLVFLVGGYFLITSAFPEIMPDDFYSYSISAGDSMITNNLRSLYLADSDALGGATEVDNVTARLITVEKPFIFVFNPKRKVAENTSAQIQLQFVNPSTEIYLNENLIVPDLDDYKKVADFSDENKEVWVKKDISGATPTENQTAEEFIYANYPGKNIYSFGEMESGTPIISDYKPTNTFISTRFRDNLKLAVYAEGDLKIDFIKQDLNMYLGKDEYTVEITDLKGNSYFKEIYGDDGDKKDSSVGEFEQEVHLIGRNLPRSIYYITFTKDEKNKGADSTIKNIRVNSNKVLIVGDILPWSDFKFYTKVSSEKIIGFNYWWGGKEQEIQLSGTKEKIIDLNESFKGVTYEQELSRGKYNFEIETGYLRVYSDVVSPSESRWFYLPQEGDGRLINQEIIIIDKNTLMIDKYKVVYTGMIDVEKGNKIKLQVLDKLKTYFKEIKLVL